MYASEGVRHLRQIIDFQNRVAEYGSLYSILNRFCKLYWSLEKNHPGVTLGRTRMSSRPPCRLYGCANEHATGLGDDAQRG